MNRLQLALATIAFAISFALWVLISALAPHFKDLYHLTPTQSSLLIAVPLILGSLSRIPIGIFADRYGGRLVFSLLLAFGIIPAADIALLHSFNSLLFWGFFPGLAGFLDQTTGSYVPGFILLAIFALAALALTAVLFFRGGHVPAAVSTSPRLTRKAG